MSLVTQGIFNLKQAQNASSHVTVFKNHEKRWARIGPNNKKATYGPGDLMVFDLKGQGVDYLNLNGSQLWMKIEITQADGTTHRPAATFLHGAYDVIYRQQTRSGAFDLEDLLDVNKFIHLNYEMSVENGPLQREWEDRASGSTVGTEIVNRTPSNFASKTKQGGTWFQVPFRTILDAGGYLSVFMLAESLELRWTLNTPIRSIVSPGGAETDKFVIHDAYILADGLVATSGGQLEQGPQKWGTSAIVSFKNQVSGSGGVNTDYTSTFSHDVKKTSLKKWVGGFWDENGYQLPSNYDSFPPANPYTVPADPAANYIGIKSYGARINPKSMNLHGVTFSMGGIQYPYINGMTDKQLLWMEVKRFSHELDNTLNTPKFPWLQYDDTWYKESYINAAHVYNNSGGAAGTPKDVPWYGDAFFCANFDRLDQMNSVVSGIDTERYDIALTLNDYRLNGQLNITAAAPTVWGDANVSDLNLEFVSFYIYNVIVTMIGGEIKIED